MRFRNSCKLQSDECWRPAARLSNSLNWTHVSIVNLQLSANIHTVEETNCSVSEEVRQKSLWLRFYISYCLAGCRSNSKDKYAENIQNCSLIPGLKPETYQQTFHQTLLTNKLINKSFTHTFLWLNLFTFLQNWVKICVVMTDLWTL